MRVSASTAGPERLFRAAAGVRARVAIELTADEFLMALEYGGVGSKDAIRDRVRSEDYHA